MMKRVFFQLGRKGLWRWLPPFLPALAALSLQAQTTQGLYADALQNGWQNYGWTLIDYAATNPVHSGTSGGQQLRLQALLNGSALPALNLAPLPANAWTLINVPLASLGVSNQTT